MATHKEVLSRRKYWNDYLQREREEREERERKEGFTKDDASELRAEIESHNWEETQPWNQYDKPL